MCICVIYKCLRSRTLDLQLNLGGQAGQSQAKLIAWEAFRSILSRVVGAAVEPSTLGERPGWTHSQQCQRHLSRSSMYKINDH
jgi:hypothetical protein